MAATAAADAPRENYLNCATGFRSWFFSVDHKRIGLMYLVSIAAFVLVGGLLALIIRMEHFTPGNTILRDEGDLYNRIFTLHGAIMTFLFIIPGIPAAIGNFVLPIMLGAKDVAFPKMNLASFHLYLAGAVLAVAAILAGGIDTGWTFYAPYSVEQGRAGVIPVVMGVFILGFSSIFTGLNFIVTIHKLRPPGMGWFKMPLLLWALYATAVIQILATPVLGITLLLLFVEKTLGMGFFNPALGGDPVLFQHFFWFYSHPAVYIMILPAMGIVSEIVSIHSHKHIFGYRFICYSSIAIALLGFFVWGHHMFVSGQSAVINMAFSALTFSVSIPSAIKVFNWLATMYKGAITLTTPMCYALVFILMFGIGGLTGLFLGALSTDVHLTDTYFIVAHFHFTMFPVGMAFLGGLYHWWPKMTGRMFSELWGKIGCLSIAVGFFGTFLPQFVAGSRGMPRRYFHIPQEYAQLHQISSAFAMLMGAGFALAFAVLAVSLFRGRRAPANPWGGASLEWRCASPPPPHNFEQTPAAVDPYDFRGIEYNAETREYVFAAPAD